MDFVFNTFNSIKSLFYPNISWSCNGDSITEKDTITFHDSDDNFVKCRDKENNNLQILEQQNFIFRFNISDPYSKNFKKMTNYINKRKRTKNKTFSINDLKNYNMKKYEYHKKK